jgi:hypothetical protein
MNICGVGQVLMAVASKIMPKDLLNVFQTSSGCCKDKQILDTAFLQSTSSYYQQFMT